MAGIAAPNIVKDGLVFLIDAANQRSYPGSGTTATDLIEDNSITLSGTTFESANNGIFNFDGNDAMATSVSDYDFNLSEFSIGMWFRIQATNTGTWQNIAAKYLGAAFQWRVQTNNSLQAYIQKSDTTYVELLDTSINYNSGDWYNVYITYKNVANSVKLYTNSVLKDTESAGTLSMINTDGALTLGCREVFGSAGSYEKYMNGEIGPISIYNKALSAAEVTQNYNALKGRFGL
jgi:hypothetical protein